MCQYYYAKKPSIILLQVKWNMLIFNNDERDASKLAETKVWILISERPHPYPPACAKTGN